MAKITYLLGAGASAKKIPIVREIPKDIQEIIGLIKTIYRKNEKLKQDFISRLASLIEVCSSHVSIDVYAKKLFLTGNTIRYRELKILLDSYFSISQLLKNGVDIRYDLFLASILEGGIDKAIQLPPNITVLSWNYDFQFELALSNFFQDTRMCFFENFLNIYPNSQNNFNNNRGFNLIKLNGTSAGVLIDNNDFKRNNFLDLKNIQLEPIINDIIDNFYKTFDNYNYTSSIQFAWENIKFVENIRNIAISSIANTDVLVVIGYSFPTFNRTVDKELLKNMKPLKRAVIQAPKEYIEEIGMRFKSLMNSVDFQPELNTDIDEFYIPIN